MWEIEIEKKGGEAEIKHNSKVKVCLFTENGEKHERIPAWACRVEQGLENGRVFYDAIHWDPPNAYLFKHNCPKKPAALKIYECHVGMSGEEGSISSYDSFRLNVLPLVHKLGYNCLQMMAVMEHSYYGSFGYQVIIPTFFNFFI